MSSVESVFATRCLADAPLVALLTGGIYANSSLDENGINRDTKPAAYDSNGYLKPVLVIKSREARVTNELVDVKEQYTTTRQPVELYFLADASAGYTTITSARAITRGLFMFKGVSGAYYARLINYLEYIRDDLLNNACLHKDVYEVSGYIG